MRGVPRSRPARCAMRAADWPMTVDETGAYTAHFKDLKGVKRLMRADDGVHFQPPAYELIGDAVLRSLRESVTPFKLLGAG